VTKKMKIFYLNTAEKKLRITKDTLCQLKKHYTKPL